MAGKSAGGWNAVLANAQKPKQDGMEVFGAKAAVIDIILEAYKKKGMGSKERKVMFASLLSLPMSQVWVRAREVSNDEELSEQLGEQDAALMRLPVCSCPTTTQHRPLTRIRHVDNRALGRPRITVGKHDREIWLIRTAT